MQTLIRVTHVTYQLPFATTLMCMLSFLSRLRSKPTEAPVDDRDLIATVNEARNDVQRERAIRAARGRRRAAGAR